MNIQAREGLSTHLTILELKLFLFIIDRQLMDSHLKERSRPPATLARAPGLGRGDEPSTAEGKRLFSFFRKI